MNTNQDMSQSNNKEDNNMPKFPLEETNNSSDEGQVSQPMSPHEGSSPREINHRISGARILRDMVAANLNIRGWAKIREKLNEI